MAYITRRRFVKCALYISYRKFSIQTLDFLSNFLSLLPETLEIDLSLNMATRSKPLALIFFLSSVLFSLSVATDEVHKLLSNHGLPEGILPDAVNSFNISTGGDFTVELYGNCYIQFDYLVYYDRVITGNLKYGSITSLKGVQVQKFMLWLNVDEIRVDLPSSDYIYFHVGVINKKLDVKQFKKARSCRKSGSFQEIWEVPASVNEIPMLLTE